MAFQPLPHGQQEQYTVVRLINIARQTHGIQTQYIKDLDISNMNERQINFIACNMQVLAHPDWIRFRNIIFPLVQQRQKYFKFQKEKQFIRKKLTIYLLIALLFVYTIIFTTSFRQTYIVVEQGESIQTITNTNKQYMGCLAIGILIAMGYGGFKYIHTDQQNY